MLPHSPNMTHRMPIMCPTYHQLHLQAFRSSVPTLRNFWRWAAVPAQRVCPWSVLWWVLKAFVCVGCVRSKPIGTRVSRYGAHHGVPSVLLTASHNLGSHQPKALCATRALHCKDMPFPSTSFLNSRLPTFIQQICQGFFTGGLDISKFGPNGSWRHSLGSGPLRSETQCFAFALLSALGPLIGNTISVRDALTQGTRPH